jgi:hypothetical protein
MNSCTSAESPCSGCEYCHNIAFQSFKSRLKHGFVTLGPSLSLIASARRVGLPDQAGSVTGSSTSGPRERFASAHGAIQMTSSWLIWRALGKPGACDQ